MTSRVVPSTTSVSRSHTYTSRGFFSVRLFVDGGLKTRTSYVFVTCKVPAFAGVRVSNAEAIWTAAGFDDDNFSAKDGNGNYKIGYQSLAGGMVHPPGGCAGATIQVGP